MSLDWVMPKAKRCKPVRKLARLVAFFERNEFKRVRPARFKPGPYRDEHGNLRFLGREKL